MPARMFRSIRAYQMASTGNSTQIHVVGDLKKDASGNIIGIEKSADKLSFSLFWWTKTRKSKKYITTNPCRPILPAPKKWW
jgi:hypothetical protein